MTHRVNDCTDAICPDPKHEGKTFYSGRWRTQQGIVNMRAYGRWYMRRRTNSPRAVMIAVARSIREKEARLGS